MRDRSRGHTHSALAARTPSRTPFTTLGHATARGIDAGVAMIRIAQIARLSRLDDAGTRAAHRDPFEAVHR